MMLRKTYIEDIEQLRAVASPLRQEIFEVLQEYGKCSIKEIAEHVGQSSESLYYHVHKLRQAGIIRQSGKRRARTRKEQTYELTYRRAEARYNLDSKDSTKVLANAAASMLRLTTRDINNALTNKLPSRNERSRDLAISRIKARLTIKEAQIVKRYMQDAEAIFRRARSAQRGKRYALTWVLTPIQEAQ